MSSVVETPPAAAAPPLPVRSPKRQRIRSETRTALLMVAPAAAGLLLFVVLPFVVAGGLSFFNVRLNTPQPAEWFGFHNYERILFDEALSGDFWRAVRNNFVFAAIVVPVQTGLALGLALLLNRPLRGMSIFRTFFFMPVVFPMALVAVVWKLIFDRGDLGMLNSFLHTISFGAINATDWLGSTTWALPSIMLMSIWQGVGFQMIILLAGLQGIPSSLYEAAAIDKASRWQQFRNVTLPGLKNTLIFVTMVTTIFSFRLFDQIYVMTQGGPDNATTTVMYQAVNTAYTQNNLGRGSAITVVFFLMVLAVTLIQRKLVKEEREVA